MTQWPRISVVVPSFNQGDFIGRTLQSIIAQEYPNLELIVMDGGSTDATVDILQQHDAHITWWTSEPDGGQTDALIKGFERATGEIMCWLNSDDLLEPSALHEVAEFFAAHPDADAVFGDTTWIDSEDRPLRVHREMPFIRFVWMHTYNYIPGMSMFWRRGVYQEVGGLDRRFDLAMDADLFIRFADAGRIAHVPNLWSRMRFYPEQKNRSLRARSDQEDAVIRARYWGTARPRAYRLKRALAYAIRLAWRLAAGAYGRGYVRDLQKLELAPSVGEAPAPHALAHHGSL